MSRTVIALSLALALGAAAPAGATTRPAHASETRIATVVKIRGLSWFERMRDGIEQFAARAGIDVTFKAAADASPVKQVRLVRRLIAERPDAITVVPNSPAALERVLARARRAGIVVVTHEASNQRNT